MIDVTAEKLRIMRSSYFCQSNSHTNEASRDLHFAFFIFIFQQLINILETVQNLRRAIL